MKKKINYYLSILFLLIVLDFIIVIIFPAASFMDLVIGNLISICLIATGKAIID